MATKTILTKERYFKKLHGIYKLDLPTKNSINLTKNYKRTLANMFLKNHDKPGRFK